MRILIQQLGPLREPFPLLTWGSGRAEGEESSGELWGSGMLPRPTLLEEQDKTIRKHMESTQLCVPNPFTQTANNNRLLRGPPDAHSDYPYFPICFEIYGVVLSLRENRGHYPHSTDRETEARRNKDAVQRQLLAN